MVVFILICDDVLFYMETNLTSSRAF